MAESNRPPVQKKVVFRPAPALLKIAVCLLILFSMLALVALRWVHNGIQDQTRALAEEAAAAEATNADLQEKIADLGSVQSVEDIAREELGLVDPDTVLVDPN